MQGGLRSDRYRHRLTIEGSDDIETETNREQMPKDGVLPPGTVLYIPESSHPPGIEWPTWHLGGVLITH